MTDNHDTCWDNILRPVILSNIMALLPCGSVGRPFARMSQLFSRHGAGYGLICELSAPPTAVFLLLGLSRLYP